MADPKPLRIKTEPVASNAQSSSAVQPQASSRLNTRANAGAVRPVGGQTANVRANSRFSLNKANEKVDDKRNFDGSVDAMTLEQERAQVRKLSVIISVLVVVLIVALGYAIYTTFTTNADLNSMSANSRPVYVAKDTIKAGSVVDASMITLEDIPSRYITDGATDNSDSIVGRVALTTIYKNEQVSPSMVFGQGNYSSLATAIERDGFAVTITVSAETGVAGLLKQGDFIDLYCLTGADDGVQGATLVMSNVRIVALDSALSNDGSTAYSTITLSVPTQADVTKILEMKQRGTLVCVLHATDVNIVNAQQSTGTKTTSTKTN